LLLSVKEASVYFGKVSGIRDVSIDVEEGQIVALIGANGAGKSTTLRAISGLKQPSSGEIWFKGERIDDLSPEEITMRGIAHVPEGRRVFPYMTVKENLEMGAFSRKDKAGIARDLEGVFRHFPRLRERLTQAAGTMSGGEQQMLAVGRALMTNPQLLVLDEATEGLAPLIRTEIWSCLADLKTARQSILIIDKNVAALTKIADRHHIVEKGRVVWNGTSEQLRADADLQARYLGV